MHTTTPKARTFTDPFFVVYLCNASVESTRSRPLPRPWRRRRTRKGPPNPGLPARRPCTHTLHCKLRTTTAMRFGGGVTARPCPHRVMSVFVRACVHMWVVSADGEGSGVRLVFETKLHPRTSPVLRGESGPGAVGMYARCSEVGCLIS